MAKRKFKTEKGPETYQEHFDHAFKRVRRDGYVPEVNYHFQPGEAVIIGHKEEVRVEEALEGGKLIHVSYHDRGESHGKPWDNHRRLPQLYWWHELAPAASAGTEILFETQRISTQYLQTQLTCLLSRCYSRGLIESPQYQRDYVWTLEDKQRLIRSVFNRADIGKFVFLEYPVQTDINALEIIDGKQRLKTLMEYKENRFPYEGKTYYQLSSRDKWAFGDIMVQTSELQAERVKPSDVFWLFLQLNAGGVPQTDEQIAKVRDMHEQALRDEVANGGKSVAQLKTEGLHA